jgi:glutamine amidotransferase
MHNGVVSNFIDIRRDLLHMMSFDAYCNVFGTTDSEHVAALFVTNLTKGGTKDTWEQEHSLEEMLEALTETVVQILTLQHQKLGAKAAPNSLNLCVTDGQKIIAIRFRNHETEQPPSLYWSEFAGRTLNRKYPGHPDAPVHNENATRGPDEHGRHTIVASEPTTHDMNEWNLISRNCALLVDEFGTETEVPITYDQALNAVDPFAP